MRTLEQGVFLASWQRPTASGENCSSKGNFFTVADAIVNIPSMKAARFNRKMRSSNLKHNKTKTGNNRISLKLPESFIRMQKPLLKGSRWSKTMLLSDNQPHRRVVLRQRWEMEANWKVIVRLLAVRLSNNQTRWYRGKRCRRSTKQLLATKRRKFLLRFLHHPSKTKDLIQGNPSSHGMHKNGTGTPRVVPKRKRSGEDSNSVTKRVSRHG